LLAVEVPTAAGRRIDERVTQSKVVSKDFLSLFCCKNHHNVTKCSVAISKL